MRDFKNGENGTGFLLCKKPLAQQKTRARSAQSRLVRNEGRLTDAQILPFLAKTENGFA